MPTWVDKILNSQTVQFALAALAFLIALWLVVVIARMLMGGRLRLSGGRTRQARLGIVDAFDLDRQRQLIIVRRDNTEHLVMIGGPNDLLIESEIVRIEARDARDTRRDKSVADIDARIPAPIVAPGSDLMPNGGVAHADEPLLPMALPQTMPPEGMTVQAAEIAPTALLNEPVGQARAPTFPLPPRRPVPPPAADRRPPPLPERAMRADEPVTPPAVSATSAAISPTQSTTAQPAPMVQPSPVLQSSPIQSSPASAGPAPATPTPSDAARPVPTRPAPPPFLKPLPPRPPARPLRRATPQAEQVPGRAAAIDGTPIVPPPGPGASGGASAPGSSGFSSSASTPAVTGQSAPPLPSAARSASAQPGSSPAAGNPGEKDALESLEEEMAKLLGRGG